MEKNQSPINSTTESTNLEQDVFNLEFFNLLRKPQMNEMSLAEERSSIEPDFTWKISGIKKQMKRKKFEMKSAVFEWAEYPEVRAQVKMKLVDDEFVSVSLSLAEPNKGKTTPDIKLIPHVYYLFRDQTKSNNSPKHLCFARSYLFTTKFKWSLDFWSTKYFASPLTDSTYNVDDSVVMEIYVEPPWMAQAARSCDGTLNWAIDNCRGRKLKEKEVMVCFHESPYFYTAPKGYRVQVRMRLVSGFKAYVDFLPGEFDADLPLTFPHHTTVTLFNRKNPERNVIKTAKGDISKEKSYFIDLCSDEEMENVIENDVIFYRVTIIKASN